MGGRGSNGGTRSTYRRNSTSLSKSGAGAGGGGKKGTKGNSGAGTGGIDGGNGSGDGSGGSEATKLANAYKLGIKYGPGLTRAQKATQQKMFDALPNHLKARLYETGTKVHVGKRADETPGWSEFANFTGWSPTTTIGDGRELGTLSFYYGATNELFISVDYPGGSVNVYTHELGHAVDFQMIGGGKLISEDPDWVTLHNDHIKDNPEINSYYRGGPTGNSDDSGRKELFAEGFAIYNAKGLNGLTQFVRTKEVAQAIVNIWKKYGVVK